MAKVGRPTKYNDEILDQTQKYIDSCEDKKYKLTRTEGDKSTTWEHKIKVNLPTIEGLAVHLKVNKTTIHEWRKDHEEFSNLIDELLAKQANMLVVNGLSGDYNPTIAKVLLTKHGYREGLDQTTNDKDLPAPIMQLPNVQRDERNEEDSETDEED